MESTWSAQNITVRERMAVKTLDTLLLDIGRIVTTAYMSTVAQVMVTHSNVADHMEEGVRAAHTVKGR